MKKLVLAAISALTAATLTGAATVPAAGGTLVHTKRLVSRTIAIHSLGPRSYVAGAAVDRHAGHVIGYDTFTSHQHSKQNLLDIYDSFAFKNGTITTVFHVKLTGTADVGRILQGTGKYKGIQGQVAERPVPNKPNSEYVTFTYHF
jgi:hypothetical protein